MNTQTAYLATVTDLYHTARYQTGRALARARWPGVAWIEPAEMGWSLDQWRAVWPGIVTTLDLLAVIPRDDLTIGRGCYQEILDCAAFGLPTFALVSGRWVPNVHVERLPGVSFRYWARVVSNG